MSCSDCLLMVRFRHRIHIIFDLNRSRSIGTKAIASVDQQHTLLLLLFSFSSRNSPIYRERREREREREKEIFGVFGGMFVDPSHGLKAGAGLAR